jgi:hypothetical protein
LLAPVLVVACARAEPAPDRFPADSPAAVVVPAAPFRSVPAPPVYTVPGTASGPVADTIPATTAFGRLIQSLSEPGGYFPSDNLVSNETSYLHVVPALSSLGVRGGAYIGVGPDQNFSYIAHIRPEVAFIIDIRRDNLLQQLLFKALFENARNRLEYLSLMVGSPLPPDPGAWEDATIDEIVVYVDTVGRSLARFEEADSVLLASIEGYGYPLSERDWSVIRGIHATFFEYGLGIKYSNSGRLREARYPTWRQLLLQMDLTQKRQNYLAAESDFRYVKRLEARNRVIPVVGDLGGRHALAAVGREIRRRGLRVSAFYVSNVEQYLIRGPGFEQYASTVAGLPYDDHGVIIRSYFPRRYALPQTVRGHISTQLLERIGAFVESEAASDSTSYQELVTRNSLPLEGK